MRSARAAQIDPIQGRSRAHEISQIMAKPLNWSAEETERQIRSYEQAVLVRFKGGKELQ